MGGTIKENNDPWDAEAKVTKTGESFTIEISSLVSGNRKRFSIAHELGHIVIHSGFLNQELWNNFKEGETFYRVGIGRFEYEANDFAAALLMPADDFCSEAYKSLEKGFFNVEYLANKYGVSKEAAIVRGRWLGIFSW